MLNQLADWLDDRTGYRALVRTFSDETIPGGARWRYVFGSALGLGLPDPGRSPAS